LRRNDHAQDFGKLYDANDIEFTEACRQQYYRKTCDSQGCRYQFDQR